jgi:6-pyruvoyltetrahydropterin/6-carboxytetrahydropterin synthase
MTKNKIPVRVTKHVEFEASHNLIHYNGPCERFHGHTYKLEVTVEGVPSNKQGLVVDFKDLKSIINSTIINKVDHEYLNRVMVDEFGMDSDQNTTCENMIVAFWYALDHPISEIAGADYIHLAEIKLWETTNSYATLTRDMVYREE